jgi:hypothetical protein
MAVGQHTEHRKPKAFWDRVFGQLTRYDLVLTAIPLAFVLAAIATIALSVPFPAALAVGAAGSAAALADALFVNPPVETETEL